MYSSNTTGTIDRSGRSLLVTLEDTRNKLEISKEEWAKHYLRVSEEEYGEILTRKQDLSVAALFYLTEKLWLNPSDLEDGTVDFDTLIRAQRGDRNYIHPRYTIAAKSRKHTILNSLNFIQNHRGVHIRNSVNRHFQIHDEFWADGLMEHINIQYVSDLMKFLSSRGFVSKDFHEMGMNSFVTLQNTEVGKKFSHLRTLPEVYDKMIHELIHIWDGNCIYWISRITESECIIESKSNTDVAEALNTRDTGSEEVCQFRAGVFASMPQYIGLRSATVHKTHCVHRGDANCRFVIDFSDHRFRDNGVRLSPVT